jgi:hypothetical protein
VRASPGRSGHLQRCWKPSKRSTSRHLPFSQLLSAQQVGLTCCCPYKCCARTASAFQCAVLNIPLLHSRPASSLPALCSPFQLPLPCYAGHSPPIPSHTPSASHSRPLPLRCTFVSPTGHPVLHSRVRSGQLTRTAPPRLAATASDCIKPTDSHALSSIPAHRSPLAALTLPSPPLPLGPPWRSLWSCSGARACKIL